MSSILKALKKMEQEKMACSDGPLEIDVQIVRDSGVAHHPRSTFLRSILPASLIFICGSAATYLYLNISDPKSIKPRPSNTAEIEKTIATEMPHILIPQGKATVESVKEPASANLQKTKSPARPAHEKLKTKTAQSAAPPQNATINQSHEKPEEQQRAVSEIVPLLRVNGIAFQPEGSDSAAIVNGTHVTGGSSINGARVEEILKDRVRFNYKGESIEVLLGRSNH